MGPGRIGQPALMEGGEDPRWAVCRRLRVSRTPRSLILGAEETSKIQPLQGKEDDELGCSRVELGPG